jgi:hypothetical protein
MKPKDRASELKQHEDIFSKNNLSIMKMKMKNKD